MPTISMTKEDLIARLEELLPAVEAFDAKALDAHHRLEDKALALFHKRCEEATKWTWEHVKSLGSGPALRYDEMPRCPRSEAAPFKQALEALKLTKQTSFRMNSDSGEYGGQLYRMVTWDGLEQESADLC